jgi:hypothetical protein
VTFGNPPLARRAVSSRFTDWDYHAFVTNREGDFLELEADHRRQAIVEQRIAELKSAGLAHLPSSHFMANAVWLALTVMAHNLAHNLGTELSSVDSLHPLSPATRRTGCPCRCRGCRSAPVAVPDVLASEISRHPLAADIPRPCRARAGWRHTRWSRR